MHVSKGPDMSQGRWIMEELERATHSQVFLENYGIMDRWAKEHLHMVPGVGLVSHEPEPPEVAVAKLEINRIKLSAIERAGARYQAALDAWTRQALLEGQGERIGLAPWPKAVRDRLGPVLDHGDEEPRRVGLDWMDEEDE